MEGRRAFFYNLSVSEGAVCCHSYKCSATGLAVFEICGSSVLINDGVRFVFTDSYYCCNYHCPYHCPHYFYYYVGGSQNYGPFLGPFLVIRHLLFRDPERDHNFDNHPCESRHNRFSSCSKVFGDVGSAGFGARDATR